MSSNPLIEAVDPLKCCQNCGSHCSTLLLGLTIGAVGGYVISRRMNKQNQVEKSVPKDGVVVKKCAENVLPVTMNDFRVGMAKITDIIVEYIHNQNTDKYKVMTENKFGAVYNLLPRNMPVHGEKYDKIFKDVIDIIMPGLLHWQHPRFHAYYGSGFSLPDIWADTLISGISVIGYDWVGAPSIVELEMAIVNWFGKAIGLDEEMLFAPKASESTGGGIFQYSSSEIIYISLMVSRNKKLNELVKNKGHNRREEEAALLPKLIVYTNSEAHSAIEKACKMALLCLRAIEPTTPDFGLTGDALEAAILKDIKLGNIPFHIHGSLGTTNSAAIDRFDELAAVARKYQCWFHVDAAYGGCAMLCPELRYLGKGLNKVDSLNVNLHKWPFCSAPLAIFWCRHREIVQGTFSVFPPYLRYESYEVPGFRHWGINLTRRATCLKAWFVFRTYGLEGMQKQIRHLIRLTDTFRQLVKDDGRFNIIGKPVLTLFVFNVKSSSLEESNRLTKDLCEFINRSSKLFVTHSKPNGIDVIRINMCRGLSYEKDVHESYEVLKQLTDEFVEKDPVYSSLKYQADIVTHIKGSPYQVSPVPSPTSNTPKTGTSEGSLTEVTARSSTTTAKDEPSKRSAS